LCMMSDAPPLLNTRLPRPPHWDPATIIYPLGPTKRTMGISISLVGAMDATAGNRRLSEYAYYLHTTHTPLVRHNTLPNTAQHTAQPLS
jgi:hypothetical protein